MLPGTKQKITVVLNQAYFAFENVFPRFQSLSRANWLLLHLFHSQSTSVYFLKCETTPLCLPESAVAPCTLHLD